MLSANNNIMAREIYLGSGEVDDSGDNGNLEDLTNQCQRYEEQIVELHSVIAELSRKLEIEQDQIIHEDRCHSCLLWGPREIWGQPPGARVQPGGTSRVPVLGALISRVKVWLKSCSAWARWS